MKKTQKIEALRKLTGSTRAENTALAAAAASLLVSMAADSRWPADPAWAAVLLCGVPIVARAARALVTRFDIRADVLVALALLASLAIGEIFAAGEVAFIMQLGGRLEEATAARARAGIERLVRLRPRTARLIADGRETVVPAEDVRAGQRLRVLPGEMIPVDGVILSGTTSVDEAVMTGEPMPADKGPGDEVTSGTVNRFGPFEMRALRVGEDSAVQRMIRLVESADAGHAPVVKLADRWAAWVVAGALAAAAGTWWVTGELLRAVTVLVVFCPCSLVLATPTAVMAAVSNAARHGFLVRDGGALERLASVKKAVFDKTGTLTEGRPEVAAVWSGGGLSGPELYRLAAAAESLSEHPLGKAVAAGWRRAHGDTLPPAEQFVLVPGQGIEATVEGRRITAGNPALMAARQIPLGPGIAEAAKAWLARGATVIYLAAEGAAEGFLALADRLRGESRSTAAAVSAEGVTPVLLTGDGRDAARAAADALGIREVEAECLPEDKLARIEAFQRERQPVCMIGDGINDAPALARADVGIAMGGAGNGIAADAADIVLVEDRIGELPHLLALAKRMMAVIRRNLAFAMALNLLATGLAMGGELTPVTGALVHNAGSVLVVLSAALLTKWQRPKKTSCAEK